MRPRALALPFVLAAAILGGCAAPPASTTEAGAVRVSYVEAERFTDAGSRSPVVDPAREPALVELRQWLEDEAARRLAPGARLEIRITDLDRAGHLVPSRRSGDLLRVVRSVTPPRIDLEFSLIDATGRTRREGALTLRDLGFEANTGARWPQDPLRHEKALLQRWLDRELAPAT